MAQHHSARYHETSQYGVGATEWYKSAQRTRQPGQVLATRPEHIPGLEIERQVQYPVGGVALGRNKVREERLVLEPYQLCGSTVPQLVPARLYQARAHSAWSAGTDMCDWYHRTGTEQCYYGTVLLELMPPPATGIARVAPYARTVPDLR
eukprot:1370500-Rhodomonas_salina.1